MITFMTFDGSVKSHGDLDISAKSNHIDMKPSQIIWSTMMKAFLDKHIVAQSDDITEAHGYSYFPSSSVRLDWLEKAPKTESDLECPHGVQFYDLVIDGERHERAAWSYEKPKPAMHHVGGRFGFWGDVKLA